MPFPMVTAYERMVRDVPRHELPSGACWSLQDVFPDRFDAPAAARGPWIDFTDTGKTALDPTGLGWAEFAGGIGSLLLASDGSAAGISSNGVTSARGTVAGFASATSFPAPPMINHRQKLVFAPRGKSGGNGLYIYDGASNVAAVTGMGGLGPLALGLYNDFSVWFGDESGTHPTRIGFSNAGDPSTYQPTVSFIDMPDNVLGGACLRDVIIVYCENSIYRIRGVIPPGNGPSDMRVEILNPKVFGLVDPRSVVYYGTSVIFANRQGVWITEGVTTKNLTQRGGIQSFWDTLFDTHTIAGIVSWVYKGYLFMSIWGGTGARTRAPLYTLCMNLATGAWSTMTDMNFYGGAAPGVWNGGDDVGLAYVGSNNTIHIANMLGVMDPDQGCLDNAVADASYTGGLIQPMIETPLMRGFMRLHRKWIPSAGLQTWRNLFLNYQMHAASATDAHILVQYDSWDQSSPSYASLPTIAADTTLVKQRRKIPLGLTTNAFGLRIQAIRDANLGWQSFRWYETEVEFYPRETSRLQ